MKENKNILIDVCCGVCFSGVFEQFKNNYEITAYWHNANIYPRSEYYQRLESFISAYQNHAIIVDNDNWDENHRKWQEFVRSEKYAKEPEGGKRCLLCYKYRLKKVAKFAKENDFNLFASTLTISPHKKAEMINNIGLAIEKEIIQSNKNDKTKYFCADFKKNDGFKIANIISKKKNIYRQNYCGCEFSISSADQI